MYDVIMTAKDNDPTFTRGSFILPPDYPEVPPGCEEISDEYIIQLEAIIS